MCVCVCVDSSETLDRKSRCVDAVDDLEVAGVDSQSHKANRLQQARNAVNRNTGLQTCDNLQLSLCIPD